MLQSPVYPIKNCRRYFQYKYRIPKVRRHRDMGNIANPQREMSSAHNKAIDSAHDPPDSAFDIRPERGILIKSIEEYAQVREITVLTEVRERVSCVCSSHASSSVACDMAAMQQRASTDAQQVGNRFGEEVRSLHRWGFRGAQLPDVDC